MSDITYFSPLTPMVRVVDNSEYSVILEVLPVKRQDLIRLGGFTGNESKIRLTYARNPSRAETRVPLTIWDSNGTVIVDTKVSVWATPMEGLEHYTHIFDTVCVDFGIDVGYTAGEKYHKVSKSFYSVYDKFRCECAWMFKYTDSSIKHVGSDPEYYIDKLFFNGRLVATLDPPSSFDASVTRQQRIKTITRQVFMGLLPKLEERLNTELRTGERFSDSSRFNMPPINIIPDTACSLPADADRSYAGVRVGANFYIKVIKDVNSRQYLLEVRDYNTDMLITESTIPEESLFRSTFDSIPGIEHMSALTPGVDIICERTF